MTPSKFRNHQEWLEWEKGSDERLRKWKEEHAIRYENAFNDQVVNWTKVKYSFGFLSPITPLYKKQYEEQLYLLGKIGNLWHDWCGTRHRHAWDDNKDERRQRIIENEKAYVKSKEPKIRIIVRDPNKVTYGHTPSTPKRKKEKRIRREFCD